MKTTTLAFGSLLLCGAAAASAQPVFQWSPAELGSPAGIVSTHERIRDTARSFCREHLHGTRGISLLTQCVKAVTDELVDSINDEGLTSFVRNGAVAEDLLAKR